jgi:hypothetical protein
MRIDPIATTVCARFVLRTQTDINSAAISRSEGAKGYEDDPCRVCRAGGFLRCLGRVRARRGRRLRGSALRRRSDRAHRRRKRPRGDGPHRLRVPRSAVRRAPDREPALASPAASDRLGWRSRRDAVRVTADQQALASSMRAAWASFAGNCDPSTPALAWPSFNQGEQVMSLVPPDPQVWTGFSDAHHCAFWAAGATTASH